MISDKVLELSELLFPHLQNRGRGSSSLMRMRGGLFISSLLFPGPACSSPPLPPLRPLGRGTVWT